MVKLRPVSPPEFRDARWTPPRDHAFLRTSIVAPLILAEVNSAALSLPLGFLRENDSIQPVALLGLAPQENLFVDPSGRWIGRHLPAVFRAIPFHLAAIEGGDRLALCVDEESGLVGDDGPELFFTPDGELAPKVKQALDFLSQVSASRLAAIAACRALDEAGVLTPWSIEVEHEAGKRKLEGLLRVDEAALAALPGDGLAALRDAGALWVAYLVLASRQNLPMLGELARRRQAEREAGRKLFESALAPEATSSTEVLFDWNALEPGQTEH